MKSYRFVRWAKVGMKAAWIPGYLILAFLLVTCEEKNIEPQSSDRSEGNEVVIQDEFENERIVIYNNPKFELMVAYSRELNGEILDIQKSDSFPAIMKDNVGNRWNVFGEAISGPYAGQKLKYMDQVKGYWFSIASFYQEATLYTENSQKDRIEKEGKEGWLIDTDFMVRAAQPNIIQALNYPDFGEFRFKELLIEGDHRAEDLILVVRVNDETRVYPERILDFHEIVNDDVLGSRVVVSFCPLTGTAYCWESNDLTFYVSGLLYNANLILGDWETNSMWSQIYGKSVFGTRQQEEMRHLRIVEMNWFGGLELVDKNQILVPPQQIPERSPYQSYKNSNSIGFPVDFVDERLPAKEKVLAVILNDRAKVYTVRDF